MKETENVFIATQAARICHADRRAAVSGRDGDDGLWLGSEIQTLL